MLMFRFVGLYGVCQFNSFVLKKKKKKDAIQNFGTMSNVINLN